MNLMFVGGGGREHALLERLRKNPRVEKIYALPGNGGMAAHAECVPIRATDIDGIVAFSTALLSLAALTGIVFCLIAILGFVVILVKTLVWGDPVGG